MLQHVNSAQEHHDLPAWFDEVAAALAYSDHIVLSGNVGDLYPSPVMSQSAFKGLNETLWEILKAAGFEAMLAFDPVGGLQIISASGKKQHAALKASKLPFGTQSTKLSDITKIHRIVTEFREFRIALLIDYASHLNGLGRENIEEFFVAVDLTSRRQRFVEGQFARNPTFWLVDYPADLPDWFVLNNALLREVQIEAPNLEDRFRFARHLAQDHGWQGNDYAAQMDRLLQQFALACDSKPLVAMDAIAKIIDAEGFDLNHISDAIRVFRTGSRRNPWTSPVLRRRMLDAEEMLKGRIKGQPHAIEKTLDILARSILGLSGAQSGAMHTKPRGVLFFVGPTGVGKTELAKSVTELLFADETLCHRFDMSEFMEESSISRLIGAPPGHPGHEKGGQLVNAALRRPFSVFLFDEVEKAHPRVLDLFLQIIDEGRLTDARGATAYFSEAVIIFTSNIGIVKGSHADNMGMNVLPSDTHSELTVKITRAVQQHFRNELQRPELLNRIGQNVVVFDFLGPAGMKAIFDSLLDRVIVRVRAEHGVAITLTQEARLNLMQLCVMDSFEGGRGIANRIETHFINPLARQFYWEAAKPEISIVGIEVQDAKTVLILDGDELKTDASMHQPVHPRHPSKKDTGRQTKRPRGDDNHWRARFEKFRH